MTCKFILAIMSFNINELVFRVYNVPHHTNKKRKKSCFNTPIIIKQVQQGTRTLNKKIISHFLKDDIIYLWRLRSKGKSQRHHLNKPRGNSFGLAEQKKKQINKDKNHNQSGLLTLSQPQHLHNVMIITYTFMTKTGYYYNLL